MHYRDTSLLGAKRSRCSEEAELIGGVAQKPCVRAKPTGLELSEFGSQQGNSQFNLLREQRAHCSPSSLKHMSGKLASSAGVERSLSAGTYAGLTSAAGLCAVLANLSDYDSLLSSPGGTEVISLRAAATAAVAECTGGLGIVRASALAKSPADDTGALASGQPTHSRQNSQSLGSVSHNTQMLSIHEHSAAESGPEEHQQGHQQEHSMDACQACPPHGAKAICGRRPKMEDAYTAIPFLLEVPIPAGQLGVNELIPPRIATHVKSASSLTSEQEGSETHSIGDASGTPVSPQGAYSPFMETLHFFGVFDGHGGAEAALHCAQTLHQRIAEALSAVSSPAAADKIKQSFAASQAETAAALSGAASKQPVCKCPADQDCTCGLRNAQSHLNSSFSDAKLQHLAGTKSGQRSDSDDSETDSAVNEAILEHRRESRQTGEQQPSVKSQPQQSANTQQPPSEHTEGHLEVASTDSDASTTTTKIESALTNAFTRADEEFGKADNAALVGTTAVVALVGSRQLYVANCGEFNLLVFWKGCE